MNFSLTLDGDVLRLDVTDVEDAPDDRGRLASIELEILRRLGYLHSDPVRRQPDGKLTFRNHRPRSTEGDLQVARKVLRGFAIEA